MVVVFAERALQHFGFAAPAVAFLADAYFVPGCGEGAVLVLGAGLEAVGEVVDLSQKLPRRQLRVLFVEHLDEGVEVVEVGLVLGDGELADGERRLAALLLLLCHAHYLYPNINISWR